MNHCQKYQLPLLFVYKILPAKATKDINTPFSIHVANWKTICIKRKRLDFQEFMTRHEADVALKNKTHRRPCYRPSIPYYVRHCNGRLNCSGRGTPSMSKCIFFCFKHHAVSTDIVILSAKPLTVWQNSRGDSRHQRENHHRRKSEYAKHPL